MTLCCVHDRSCAGSIYSGPLELLSSTSQTMTMDEELDLKKVPVLHMNELSAVIHP